MQICIKNDQKKNLTVNSKEDWNKNFFSTKFHKKVAK